ncbi:2-C-methyl-D-erythritol 4-phosphate cytidylyltransferase [Crateriforma spongiae]|uniref:2-C-methyl-D-erythritol 4-phosphate cytidylyltransferase n=1 Tax=Crateriforma spongiae TaxID=2724528 RepID=UPI001F24A926|nr:2-C-methyl-D-erythritol 4-phosphate cytidylyltransferase [Crateriforma spongiae]
MQTLSPTNAWQSPTIGPPNSPIEMLPDRDPDASDDRPERAESEFAATDRSQRDICVILPAGGSGRRFASSDNKVFAALAGIPLWIHTARRLCRSSQVCQLIVAASPTDQPTFRQHLERWPLPRPVEIVDGGRERFDSVRNAIAAVDTDTANWVAIHDAARPLVPTSDIDSVFDAARETGAAILASPLAGSIKRDIGQDCRNVDRRDLWMALTPQVFKLDWIREAYQRHRGYPVTDDAAMVEAMGRPVQLVQGSPANLKITYPDDLAVAEALMQAQTSDAQKNSGATN